MRIAIPFCLCSLLLGACYPTKTESVPCTTDLDCTSFSAGLMCDTAKNVCVCDGTSRYPGCDKFMDGGTTSDGPTEDLPITPNDGDAQPDGRPDALVDDAHADLGPDTRVPDALGTCGTSGDCVDPVKGFCVGGVCMGCTASLCSSLVDGGAVDGGAATAFCATSGPAAGKCVACVDNSGCTKDPAQGICVNNACTGCQNAGPNACSGTKPACATTGAALGQCVECIDNNGCVANVAKGFCVGNACTGCTAALCAGRADGKTACATTGTFGGQCVTCTSNAQCSGTTPICGATTASCRPCATDSECSAIGPGVCMTDGHCATDADTIYVGTIGTATCSDTAANAGSAAAPYCTAQTGIGTAKLKSKPLVVMTGALSPSSPVISTGVTIVGKSGAVITPTAVSDGITITSGEIYLRNLTIQGSASTSTGIGISAVTGATLHMDTCAVKNNPGGGILLNGAAFDIRNTSVTGNGPNATGWGGIQVQALPPSGPTTLNLVTISNNKPIGLTCSSSIAATDSGTGVLATGNIGGIDISSTCGITACTTAPTTCGAQTTPQ